MQELPAPAADTRAYSATPTPEIVTIGPACFMALRGTGSPSERIFYERIAALFATAQVLTDQYAASATPFPQAILEGLYWHDEAKHGFISIAEIFSKVPLAELEYRLLIRVPAFITTEIIARSTATAAQQGNSSASQIALFEYVEGPSVQMLHAGPFKYEEVTLQAIEDFMKAHDLRKGGLHHEIYLTDFTQVTSQENLQTILREPFAANS
jgi:hypothetical protein